MAQEATVRFIKLEDLELVISSIKNLLTPDEIQNKQFGIQINGRHLINEEERTITFEIIVDFVHSKNKSLIVHYVTASTFEIVNFDDIVKPANDKEGQKGFMIEGPVVTMLLSVSISTIRGALHSKLSNTLLSGTLLPIISIHDMVKNMDGVEPSHG